MRVLLWGSGLFCVAFFLHVLAWKIRIPKGQTKAILYIFFGVLCAWLLGALLLLRASLPLASILPRNVAEYGHVIFFMGTLTLYYISFYTLIEADSPSLIIALRVWEAGSLGLREEELFKAFNDEMLVVSRLNDLLEASMVRYEDGRYKINPSGKAFIRPFIAFRKALKCGIGG